jgi:hypothetical protein
MVTTGRSLPWAQWNAVSRQLPSDLLLEIPSPLLFNGWRRWASCEERSLYEMRGKIRCWVNRNRWNVWWWWLSISPADSRFAHSDHRGMIVHSGISLVLNSILTGWFFATFDAGYSSKVCLPYQPFKFVAEDWQPAVLAIHVTLCVCVFTNAEMAKLRELAWNECVFSFANFCSIDLQLNITHAELHTPGMQHIPPLPLQWHALAAEQNIDSFIPGTAQRWRIRLPAPARNSIVPSRMPLFSHSWILYNYDQLFKHLVIFGQKKIKTNPKNQKKNILGEQFFWLWCVTEELVIILQYPTSGIAHAHRHRNYTF